MKSIGVTLSKYRRRLLYKYYKLSLIRYIFQKDHDWDYQYLLELIYKKLTNIALVIRKEEITMEDKTIAHQIWEARKILKKVLNFDYEEEQEKTVDCEMMKKYGYTIDFDTTFAGNRLDFNYFPVYYINGCHITVAHDFEVDKKLTNFNEAKEYFDDLTRKSYELAFNDKKQDLQKFFNYVVEHIWEWAD